MRQGRTTLAGGLFLAPAESWLVRLGQKAQGDTVIAKSLAGRPGPVIKDVAVVAPAARAVILRARVRQRPVVLELHGPGKRRIETGLARSAVVLGLARKQ